MNKKLFLYKLLINLKARNKIIDIDSIYNIHSDFINTLEIYNLNSYAKKFSKVNIFVSEIIYSFVEFELGIYINNSLYFYEDIITLNSLLKYEADIPNKLMNELSIIFSILLNEQDENKKKQLIL